MILVQNRLIYTFLQFFLLLSAFHTGKHVDFDATIFGQSIGPPNLMHRTIANAYGGAYKSPESIVSGALLT